MSKILCFDFGNSRLKCGIMENGSFQEEIVLDGLPEEMRQLLEQHRPDKTILASVIHHDPEVEDILSGYGHFHKVTSGSKLRVTVPSRTEKSVGADRWAMLTGAVDAFPRQHNLVIGMGSCITYNFVNKFGQFLGGAISPGLNMRLKSLHQFTANLPVVEPKWNLPLIGYDTTTNILSGVILGIVKEIDGFIDDYSLKYTKFNILLTGGDLSFFVSHFKNKIVADPYLMYKGLYLIGEDNA